MKNAILAAFVLFLFVIVSGCGKKQQVDTRSGDISQTEKNEKVSENTSNSEIGENTSYHVVYTLGTGNKNTTLELWTKGTKARSESSYEVSGGKMNAVAYFPGDGYVYAITGFGKNKMAMKIKATDANGNDMDLNTSMFKAKEHLKNFEKEGTADIIGYNCNVYRDKEGNKFYFYKDYVMLKFEGTKTTIEAVKLDRNSSESDDFFAVPSDIKFREFDANKYKN